MYAVQMNTRLSAEVKRAGDSVLARYGISPSEAVRRLWEYLSTNGVIPDCLRREREAPDEEDDYMRRVREGAGMVTRYAVEHGIIKEGESLLGDRSLEEWEEFFEEERYKDFVKECEEIGTPII